mgnify:CR=1 FL=1
MKKKNITLVFVAIVFSIIVGMIIGKSLLKYKDCLLYTSDAAANSRV